MNASQILDAITSVIEALEELGIPYHIGGSVASSLYGLPRLTIDVDIIADLRLEHIRHVVIRLQTDYYIDEDMIRDAIRGRSSFIYFPGKNASKLLAAGFANNHTT
jgi:hypothetical protein